MTHNTHSRVFGMFAPFTLITASLIQYTGAAFAVQLFELAGAGAVAWGRIAAAALVLLLLFRPKIPVRQMWAPVLFGLAITGMNVIFYYAIADIPLGTAVALEFLGPIVLSGVTGRGWRMRLGLILALAGVFMISWVGVDLSDPNVLRGVLLALLAGGLWASYIALGKRVVTGGNGAQSLTVGMTAGAIFFSPLAVLHFAPILFDPKALLLVFLVGVFSSVVPFIIEVTVMRYIATPVYALLGSLYPATSLLVGVLLLHQYPNFGEVVGLICITIAVILVSLKPRKPEPASAQHMNTAAGHTDAH